MVYFDRCRNPLRSSKTGEFWAITVVGRPVSCDTQIPSPGLTHSRRGQAALSEGLLALEPLHLGGFGGNLLAVLVAGVLLGTAVWVVGIAALAWVGSRAARRSTHGSSHSPFQTAYPEFV